MDEPLKEPRLKSEVFWLQMFGNFGLTQEEPAIRWCLEAFVNKFVDEKETDLTFEQIKELFLNNPEQIINQKNVVAPIRAFCSSYIEWIQVTTYFCISL